MKSNFIQLTNPCSEQWEKMQPNNKGRFCHTCAKNVLDLTNASQAEIAAQLKAANGNLCARISRDQLKRPIPVITSTTDKEYKFPFSQIAAGVLMATTLAVGNTAQAEPMPVQTEMVQPTNVSAKVLVQEQTKPKPNATTTNTFTTITGKVISPVNEQPIEHAKIMLVTASKLITTYSLADGTFSLEVPTELIDDDNVLRFTFFDIVENKEAADSFKVYESADYIFTASDIAKPITIVAEQDYLVAGGIGYYVEPKDPPKPVVLENGVRIRYKDFEKALVGKKTKNCSLENKDFLHFEKEEAIAIYGEAAKDGLYIIIPKEKK